MKRAFFIVTLLGLVPGLLALILSICTFPQARGILDEIIKGNSDFSSFYKVSGRVFRQEVIIAIRSLDNNALSIACVIAGMLLYGLGMYLFLYRR